MDIYFHMETEIYRHVNQERKQNLGVTMFGMVTFITYVFVMLSILQSKFIQKGYKKTENFEHGVVLLVAFIYSTYVWYEFLAKTCLQVHQRSAERLREMCSRNGGAFIKVGQHIGSLEYLLPKEYVQTMKVFHNQAPQSALEELYKVIEEDLGQQVS